MDSQVSAITKEKIISTTIKLLEDYGYDFASIRNICKAADISASRINYHYGSKDDLMTEIIYMLGRKVKEYLQKNVPNYGEGRELQSTLLFSSLLLKVMYTDCEYMKKYRELYSKEFFAKEMTKLLTESIIRYMNNKKLDYTPTEIVIRANICTYGITFLAREEIWEQLHNDTDEAILIVINYIIYTLKLDEKTRNVTIEKIKEIIGNVEFEINGLVDVDFK